MSEDKQYPAPQTQTLASKEDLNEIARALQDLWSVVKPEPRPSPFDAVWREYAAEIRRVVLKNTPPQEHLRGDGEAAIIECLAAGQSFVFDPATNFLHADDGTVQGIRYIAEHGDLPQSPWPASDWAIDRIEKLEAALKPFARIAEMEENTPAGDSTLVNIDRCREARAVLTATTEGQS